MVHRSRIGRRRTAAIAAAGVVALLAALVTVVGPGSSAFADGTNGSPKTFSQVSCTAHVNNSTITQKEDITVYAVAPNNVDPGATFSVSFPSIAADLPSSSNGLTINSYKDLKTVYKVNGGTVVAGSGTTDGPATINGNPTPAQNDTNGANIQPTIPGPIPPGHLVPPNDAANVTAGADGTTITISAVEVDTTANVQSFGDVQVTCPVPANTLTTTQVGTPASTTTTTAGPTTTVAGATTTTVPGDSGNSLVCNATGSATFKPGLPATGANAPKKSSEAILVKGHLASCHGGPPGLKNGPVTLGSFQATGKIVTALGHALPSCASLESSNSAVPLKLATKLYNSTKKVAALKANVTLGPIDTSGATATFAFHGVVATKGAFNGQPISGHFVTALSAAQLDTACHASGGLTQLNFDNSHFVVGTPPTETTTTTTTVAPTTTAAPTTTTTEEPTTTTEPPTTTTFLPQPVADAIGQACSNLAAAVAPAGVDIGPLYVACVETVNGNGPTLLNLFLDNPVLGCVALAGIPVASDPQVAAACVQFATAIQPYSSQIGGALSSLP